MNIVIFLFFKLIKSKKDVYFTFIYNFKKHFIYFDSEIVIEAMICDFQENRLL